MWHVYSKPELWSQRHLLPGNGYFNTFSMATKSHDRSNRYTCNNRGTVGCDVLYWVHVEAIYQELKPLVRRVLSQKWVLARDSEWGQTRQGVIGQEVQTCRAMRQSVASKDVNTEAEESMALGAVTKQWLLKRQQTEKT